MVTNYEKVQEFHRAAEVEHPEYPTLPSLERWTLRDDLITEEFWELKDAYAARDIVKFADALGDLLYVVYGTADEAGIDADAVFAEVHRSNMSKVVDSKVERRWDGKIMKPEGYFPPDIEGVLDAQEVLV